MWRERFASIGEYAVASPLVIIVGLGVLLTFIMPALLLYVLLSNFLITLLIHFVKKEPSVVDIGMDLGPPMARFKIRDQEFRIRIIPLGIAVNNKEEPAYEMIVAIAILVSCFFILTLAFWIDGWPDLQVQPSTVMTESGRENEGLRWEERLQKFGRTKVIDVAEESPASRAGFRYGDIITAINDRKQPSSLEVANTLVNSENVSLQVERNGITNDLVLNREPVGGKRTPFGLTILPSLEIEKNVLVEGVLVNGEAYKQGIRLGDQLEVQPEAPYLSYGVLRDRKYDAVFVARRSNNSKTEGPEIPAKIIPANELGDNWTESLVLRERYSQYMPTLIESMKFSLIRFVRSAPLVPWQGAQVSANPLLSQLGGVNRYWRTAKSFSTFFIFLSFYNLLLGAMNKLFGNSFLWLFVPLLGTLVSVAKLPFVDHLLLRLFMLLPFGDALSAIRV